MAEEDTPYDALASECLLTSALIRKQAYMQHRYIPHTTQQYMHTITTIITIKCILEKTASSTYSVGA